MLPPPRELPERAPRLAQGRYVLLARIGRGGMAGVYAAWDTRDEEWRAVKVLLPKHARDKSLRTRFENEAATMKSLSHPNLVRVYDVGSGEKLPFLVMELVNAGSLYRWTKTYGVMPPRMAVDAMIQLCAGLAAVHLHGVVHRDIKPRNILINGDGALKLTDFGIAQLESSHETRTGLAMGTLGFMSPEQLHDAKSVDLRTDIYAIGATLWTQITARKARDLFRLDDKPTLMDGVPEIVRPLLAKCLAYERDDRYSTADELADALRELVPMLPEDPADTPPLPLNLGAPSLKSKPENTFSEILTLAPEDAVEDDSALKVSRPPVSRRELEAEALQPPKKRAPRPIHDHPPSAARAPGAAADLRTRTAAEVLRPDAPDAALPAYMDGVAQPRDLLRAEYITYQAPRPDAPAPSRIWLKRVVAAAVVAPVALVLLVVVAFGVAAGVGAWSVSSAERDAREARVLLDDNVRFAEALPDELEALEVDGAPVREAWRGWAAATTPEGKAAAALVFVALAAEKGRPELGLGVRPHEEEIVRQRLEKLDEVRKNVEARDAEWARVAATPWGRLAIGLGLGDRPADASGEEG